MECQASLKSICQAFEVLNRDKILTGSHKMYPIIIDAFEEYKLLYLPLLCTMFVMHASYKVPTTDAMLTLLMAHKWLIKCFCVAVQYE